MAPTNGAVYDLTPLFYSIWEKISWPSKRPQFEVLGIWYPYLLDFFSLK